MVAAAPPAKPSPRTPPVPSSRPSAPSPTASSPSPSRRRGRSRLLLAAAGLDGSIAVYDASRSFALRRMLSGAHDGFSVVKVEWVARPSAGGWLLTSAGMDGVVRRWDLRAAATAATGSASGVGGVPGLVNEWRGHRGGGEGGGVLDFVQSVGGETVVTAGDDGVVLVFKA